MIPEMGSLTQKASDARPHHWGEPTAQASLSGGQIAQATGLARVIGQAPHSGRPSPQGETGGLRLGAMGRRHKKQDARVRARANPYERSDALCRFHSPVLV